MRELLDFELIVCAGPGGVGKTTSAAAIATAGAIHGLATCVITVDPARRLKDALRLAELGTDPVRVKGDGFEFDALALDTKRTFDSVIERFAPSPAIASRILGNRLYEEISNEVAGSGEYMAMEKLHELASSERYDLLVVDTPPSSNARDLIAAPNRLGNLLASRALDILKAPTSILGIADNRFSKMTLSALLNALERWTGFDLLNDLGDFVDSFEGMIDGFQQRAREVHQLLRDEHTAFVLVTTAEPHTVATTIDYQRELQESGLPLAGLVVNRVHDFAPLPPTVLAPAGVDERFWKKAVRNHRELVTLAQRDQTMIEKLTAETGIAPRALLPALDDNPSTLESLARLGASISAPQAAEIEAS